MVKVYLDEQAEHMEHKESHKHLKPITDEMEQITNRA
jgi:hypothetical protein